MMSVLMAFVVTVAVISLAAQSAPPPGQHPLPEYDIDFIGPPMTDPLLQHAKEQYVLFGCAYCHGLYLVARGEATDLMHSRLVGGDVDANTIGPLLRRGIPQTAKLSPMPQFSDLSDQQIAAIARWIHYARQQGRLRELTTGTPVHGDAVAGRALFDHTCAACHAVAGDLAHIGASRDAAALRAEILQPTRLEAPPSYRVDQLHDTRRAAGRARHHALLENYNATDVENLVAYLQTLK